MADDISEMNAPDRADRVVIAADRQRDIERLENLLITPEQILEIMGSGDEDEADWAKQQQVEQHLRQRLETLLLRMKATRQARAELLSNPDNVAISPKQLLLVLPASDDASQPINCPGVEA